MSAVVDIVRALLVSVVCGNRPLTMACMPANMARSSVMCVLMGASSLVGLPPPRFWCWHP